MSPFAHCLMMVAIYKNLTDVFSAGDYGGLDDLERALVIQVERFPSDDLREAQKLAVEMLIAVAEYDEDKVRRAHGTMPVV